MAAWVDLATVQSFIGNTNANDVAAIQAATNLGCDKVVEKCGPIIAETIVERVRGGGYNLPLKFYPASLGSIATRPGGVALDLADYRFKGQLLAREDDGWIAGNLTVTYTAGWAEAPSWAVSAACLIAKQWFISRLRPNLNDPSTLTGFLVPNQAMEILEGHLLAPDGFA